MFGLFSRKTSAPVIAQVTTTGSDVPASLMRAPPRRTQRGALRVGDRRERRRPRDPRGRARTSPRRRRCRPGRRSARASSRSSVPSSLTSHSTVTEPNSGSISRAKLDRAAPDDVLVAADPALAQERVAALLEVGEHDGVVDVPERVDVAPAHLHPVSGRRRSCRRLPTRSTPSASRSAAALAHEVERVGAPVGRVAAADQHPHVGPDPVGGQRGRREAASPSRRRGPCRPRAVSRIAAGSQPVALTTTTVRSAGGAPAARSAATRRQRVAQVGGDRRRRRGRALRDRARAPRRRRRRRPPCRRARRRARPPARACRRGRRRARDVVRRRRRARAPATRRRRRRARRCAVASGRSSGSGRPAGALGRRRRCRSTSTCGEAGSSRPTASSRSGVSVSEASVTIALADAGRVRAGARRPPPTVP